MEAALAVAALVAVLVLCVSGLAAIGAQLRCVDAAREAALLAARGDQHSAVAAVRAIAPVGAALQLRRDGPFVVATVDAGVLLPGLRVHAEGIAAVEPGA